ncbi:MAG: M1 family aminopeptidase [Bacteroidota bacterium]|nr:M1 family aminopeptidase [Bacteroidota bacterium]
MRLYFILAAFLFSNASFSQNKYNPLSKPNTYNQVDNPNYWKNKAPAGYWQQDVHYTIIANIDETKDIIDATEQLVYWNNSPDDLNELYFHLYQNAFTPNSYCSELHNQNQKEINYGRYEKEGLGTVVKNLKVDGKLVKTILDNTILKVILNEPLKSGDKITINMDFKTYFDTGSLRRRMKTFNAFGNTHYDGVLWYPRIAVYDKKFGWTKDQHLGKEFYGDFGTFDVELTFASNYIVEATGALQNRDEVMPASLREKLDIKNFANKPWNSPPSIIIPYDSLSRKTWIYHAENVHDFAFTADPTYRIGEAEWNGIRAISLVQEPHASRWQNAADFAAKVIQVFSEDIGMYVYNKIIVADARDGMEYPMITLDSGSDPGYRGLLAHEIGHQWFYAQVGSNETYRAAMDEGFTQFLTAWALTKIDGDYLVREKPSSKYGIRFTKDVKAIDSRVYYAYLRDATKYNDPALNTHSDDFGSALGHGGGYRHVYYKTGAMLYNLQYVLGDELFLEAMQHYFQKWKMAHPYFEDFRESIIEYTKVDLNWFFDQWLETSKTIDYSINNVKNTNKDNFEITFERKGEMQMPIDFSVYANDGKEYKYHIPNHWFVKNTDATVLNKWHAWGKLYPMYTASVNIPSGIERVVIDPTNRLADKYMLNNVSKVPMEVDFDSRVWNMPDWKQYELNARPDVWYNNYDGIKLGFHFNGDYMNYHHKVDASVWLNTAFLQDYNYYDYYQNEYNPFSYRFNYNTGLDKFSKHTDITLHSRLLDGLNLNKIKLKKYDYSKKNMFYALFKTIYRANESDLIYTNYKVWESEKFNNTATFGWTHSYKYKGGDGKLNLELTSSTIASDYDYSKVVLTSVHKSKLGKLQLNTRLFGQYGSGTNWAGESRLNLAGANSEELMENKFTRSEGFIPNQWLGYGSTTNHFQMGGGLNLRGYAGYYAPEINDEGNYVLSYNGTSGASISAELEFQNIFSLKRIFGLPFKSYLFADAGVINTTEITRENYKEAFSKVRSDAGLGFALTLNEWGPLQMVKPITLRLDLPLFLNRYPSVDEDYYQSNRFVVGIGRTF